VALTWGGHSSGAARLSAMAFLATREVAYAPGGNSGGGILAKKRIREQGDVMWGFLRGCSGTKVFRPSSWAVVVYSWPPLFIRRTFRASPGKGSATGLRLQQESKKKRPCSDIGRATKNPGGRDEKKGNSESNPPNSIRRVCRNRRKKKDLNANKMRHHLGDEGGVVVHGGANLGGGGFQNATFLFGRSRKKLINPKRPS